MAWFLNGRLNASVCCIDQHLPHRQDQTAIVWEGDEPGDSRAITYKELYQEVCRLANAMKAMGVRKGDVVMLYLPMVPEVVFAMLACARIGAPHSVVFAGFSAEALRDRINDSHSKWVMTTDEGKRGGKTLPLKSDRGQGFGGGAECEALLYVSTDGCQGRVDGGEGCEDGGGDEAAATLLSCRAHG